ncbi:hypothetical protein CHARACLAT_007963 [Characodon lateralis]|uniref:Uncharacterized protein n=1 Tax=Characodon lateralis TaxID=208331 RepID=A0ABU7DGU5_9TELE|nr:hypothetical protein [Characodon lateralis]
MSSLHRIAGHSLRDRVRSSAIREELRVDPLHLRIEKSQVARASVLDASWTPPLGSVPGTSHREETQGMAQNTLEGLCLSAGLRTPRVSPRGAAGGVLGEGHLGISA